MDAIESIYRQTPRNPITLKSYVKALLERGHILEAKFFFEQLKTEDPKGLETNRLGYLLSMEMLDPMVGEFDKNLASAGATQEQRYALHLHYYYRFSNLARMRDCVRTLLDLEPTEEYTYRVILESVIRLEDLDLVSKVARYILPRIRPDEKLLRSLRRIPYSRLLGLLNARCRRI